MKIGKYQILFVTAIDKKFNHWEDPEWYRCSIRYLIGNLLLGRVEYWKFELWVWPKIKWFKK